MKNLSLKNRKALRLAASVSLAFAALVSSAHAQSTVTHSLTLRTGNDHQNNDTLTPGDEDGSISVLPLGPQVNNQAFLLSQADFFDAVWGERALVITPHSGWGVPFGDSEARWIHSDHTLNAPDGSGTNDISALYAHPFELPANMPGDATVQIQLEWQADNFLQEAYFGDAYNQTALGISGGSHVASTTQVLSGTADSLGLKAGTNTFFFHQETTSTQYWAGIRYSMEVTVEYCAIGRELRSGMGYDSNAGWYWLLPGSLDPHVRQVTLPESYTSADLSAAFSTLSPPTSGGSSAITVNSSGDWSGLSEPANWIFGGHHDKSVLYAHDFYLPSPLPGNLQVTLDLEWAADDELNEAYINGNPLNILSGASGPNSYSAPTTNSVTSDVSTLGLTPGLNTLYLLQDDLHDFHAGLIYFAYLEVEYDCEGYEEEISYSSFCECVSDWGPCGNPGQPGQGCGNSTGVGSRLTASGTNSNITLHADNLPTGQTIGLFFRGTNQIGPIPFGDGLRCVGGSVDRVKVVITSTGQANYGPVPSGALYQFWYRDNAGPCGFGFNLSSAIDIP